MLRPFISFLALIVAAVIGGLVVSWMHGAPPQPPLNRAAVARALSGGLTASVSEMPASARVELGGYVEPRDIVHLAAQAPGRIAYISGREGNHVNAGQLVVALDDDALKGQYRAAWAGLASQMASQENAQTQLYNKLYGPRTTSMGGPAFDAYQQFTQPFYNMAQSFFAPFMPGGPTVNRPGQTEAQAQYAAPALNAALAQYEQQLAALVGSQSKIDALDAQTRMRRAISPVQGVILKRYVRVGDVVQPGQPLADVGDPDALDIRLEAPIAQVAQITLGEQVPITLNGVNLWAPVTQIFPAANPAQHTVTVKLALPANAPAASGMYARAWIPQRGGGGPSQLTPAVPTNAIVYHGSLPAAYVQLSDGTLEMRLLRLGDTVGNRVAVLAGLQPGERVIINPPPNLKSGTSAFDMQP